MYLKHLLQKKSTLIEDLANIICMTDPFYPYYQYTYKT